MSIGDKSYDYEKIIFFTLREKIKTGKQTTMFFYSLLTKANSRAFPGRTGKNKIEVLTANYDLSNPRESLSLFYFENTRLSNFKPIFFNKTIFVICLKSFHSAIPRFLLRTGITGSFGFLGSH